LHRALGPTGWEWEAKEHDMLKITEVFAAMPAQDLKRAREFYEQKLGLTPAEEQPDNGGVVYKIGQSGILVFQSMGKASGDHTQLGINVENIDSALNELKSKGVKLEEYDYPNFKTVNGILEFPDGSKGAWFKDTEGNLIAVNQMVRAAAAGSSSRGASTSR
jgi:predicted enzyme related to lactoylglutathione lyase